MTKEQRMKEENIRLRAALAVCLNRPLIKEIKSALVRMQKGKFVDEEEFLRQSI